MKFLKYLFITSLLTVSSVINAAQFTLTWIDNSNNELGFKIERAAGLNATSGFSQIATVPVDVVTYIDSNLPNSTSYSYRVRAYNAAGDSQYSNIAYDTTPAAVNTAPTISNIIDRTININSNTGAISFVIGDSQTAPTSLTVGGVSSNTTLVPNANIVFGGSGANRTVTITPAANQIGTTTITIGVSDGTLTASDTFVLTVVQPTPTPPSGLTLTGSQ